MPLPIDHNKIVVFTGAGVSAESGLQTFRDSDGLWCNYAIEDVCTPEALQRNPQLVLDFYNNRRAESAAASPNAAHKAIAELEKKYNVVVITQNVDNLHERAGSTQVIHLHGELTKARSSSNENHIIDIGNKPINLGDQCEQGSQLRPHIVFFGEAMHHYEISSQHIMTAARILVIGTSLTVYPAAGLVTDAQPDAEKILVCLDIDTKPHDYHFMQGTAAKLVPSITRSWLEDKKAF